MHHRKISIHQSLEEFAKSILGLPDDISWKESALRQIDRARPPRLREQEIVGDAVIAYWLERHLSFPTFLLSDAEAAIRIGIDPLKFSDFLALLSKNLKLSKIKYRKIQSPRRWWRAGIDELLYESENEIENAIKMYRINTLDVPVIIYDENLHETDTFAYVEDCVRVHDHTFPVSADPVYVLRETAKQHEHLRLRIIYEDRDLV